MAELKTLHDLFVRELRDAYDARKQMLKAWRKMARATRHEALSEEFTGRLEEARTQIATLQQVFALLDLKPRGKHCPGIAGIIEESDEAIEDTRKKSAVRDAALIGGARRAGHYEIAAYTTLIALAASLDLPEVASTLQTILTQEIAADDRLDVVATAMLAASEERAPSAERTAG